MLRDPVDQLGLIEYDPAGAVDYLDGIDGRTDAFGCDADRRFEILRRLFVLAGRARSNDVGWCSSHSRSDAFASQTEGLMESATEDELVAAYRRTGGEVGDLAAEALLDEMRRRNLDE